MRCISMRLVSLCACSTCAYCYYALAQHKHMVTKRILSISVVKVKNCKKI